MADLKDQFYKKSMFEMLKKILPVNDPQMPFCEDLSIEML